MGLRQEDLVKKKELETAQEVQENRKGIFRIARDYIGTELHKAILGEILITEAVGNISYIQYTGYSSLFESCQKPPLSRWYDIYFNDEEGVTVKRNTGGDCHGNPNVRHGSIQEQACKFRPADATKRVQ